MRPKFTSSCRTLAALSIIAALTVLPCAARDAPVVDEFEYIQARVSKVDSTQELRVTVSALGRAYHLRVGPNPRLDRWAGSSHWRHYQGTIEGDPGSWVRVSIDGDLVRGVIFDGRAMLAIEPQEGGGLAMFRLSGMHFETPFSFDGDTVTVPGVLLPIPGQEKVGSAPGAVEAHALTPDRQLEISVVGDAAFRARYASDADARDAVLTRLNIVDGIYSSQLGVAIDVASINIADALGDSLDSTTDPPILLDSLGRLRQQTPALDSLGLTHLFTGRDLDGNSVGIAYDGTLCNQRYSSSLAEAHDSASVDALISAHEIGHVFGAPHDGDGQCASTSSTEFIMAPVLNPRATAFSQCSLDQMAPRVASGSCLKRLSSPPPPPTTPPVEEPAPPAGGSGGGGAFDVLLLGMLAAALVSACRARIARVVRTDTAPRLPPAVSCPRARRCHCA